MVEDIREVLSVEHEVDRRNNRPQPRNGKAQHNEGAVVMGEQRHTVPLRDAPHRQRISGTVDRTVQLCIRVRMVAEHKRRRVRHTCCRTPQQIAQLLATRAAYLHIMLHCRNSSHLYRSVTSNRGRCLFQ